MNLVPYAIPFFILAVLLELALDVRRGTTYYRINDALNSMSLGTISTTSQLLLINIGGIAYTWVQNHFALSSWSLELWWNWLAAFVLYDLCYYWFHRISHERKLFWAAHVVHHQSEEYNLTTALRQTSTGFLLSWIFYLPCFLVGVPGEMFITVASVNLIYQFWVHIRFIPELGVLEKFLITASNHRVHHARNACYLDRNYGGVFIVWDRLFGTYQRELPEQPVDYGITHGLNSWNPLWANLHIYADMLRDSRTTPRWGDKLRVWLGRTNYIAPGVHEEPIHAGNHYDPATSAYLRSYALVQFIIAVLLGGVVLFSGNATHYTPPILIAFIFMLWSFINIGWLLEGHGQRSEWLRLALGLLVAVTLDTLWTIPLAALATLSLASFGWLQQQKLLVVKSSTDEASAALSKTSG